jgi:hypothetical protein
MSNFTGQLITSPQTLTGSWTNLGDAFEIDTYRSILIQLKITPNDSTGIKFRALIYSNGDGYQLSKRKIRIDEADLIIPSEQEIEELSDGKANVGFKIPDGASQIQIQVMAEVVGTTAGTIDEAIAIRSYQSDISGQEVQDAIKITGNNQKIAVIDSLTSSLINLDHTHSEIHNGNFYSFCNYDTDLDNAGVMEFILTTPNTTKWSHFTYNFSASLQILFELFEDTTHTTNVLQESYNHNRNSLNTAGMTIHTSNNDGVDGNRIDCGSFGSPSVGIVGGSGGGSRAERERVLKQNTKYLIRLTSGSNDNNVNLKLSWYEHL